MIHDPILINIDDNEKISEKVLKKYILKELEHFFLGSGFTLVLKYDNKNYYVDLLLFNKELNSRGRATIAHNRTFVKQVNSRNDISTR